VPFFPSLEKKLILPSWCVRFPYPNFFFPYDAAPPFSFQTLSARTALWSLSLLYVFNPQLCSFFPDNPPAGGRLRWLVLKAFSFRAIVQILGAPANFSI